jgi:curved DNA-binding protein CbpA
VAVREPIGDLYEELGVKPDATREEIASAYRARAKALHPDAHPGEETAAEQFTRLGAAYRVLSDPDARELYDASRRAPVVPETVPAPAPPRPAPPARPRISRRAARWFVWGGAALMVLGLAAGVFVVSLQRHDADLRAHGVATTAVVVQVGGERRLEFETGDGRLVRAAESVKTGEEQPAIGSRVRIHYDRSDPSTIVTDEDHTGRNVTLWIVAIKFVLGGAVLVGFGIHRLQRG